jgi:hypothetical protein
MSTEISHVDARQGETRNRMRYVLAASLALSVVALAIVAGTVLS